MTHRHVTKLRDPSNRVTYKVEAFRVLARDEMKRAIAMALEERARRGDPPLRNCTFRIITLIGHDGR